MRNLKKLFVVLFVVVAFSCGKSEGESNDSIVGTWAVQSITSSGVVKDLDDCNKKTSMTFTETGFKDVYVETDSDGKCVSENTEGTYTISGNILTMTYKLVGEEEVKTKTFVVEGNTLTTTEVEKEINTTITEVIVYKRQ